MFIIFIIIICTVPSICQDNSDYFPYKKYNYWEYYWIESCCPDTIVSLSVFDSVDNEGRKIAVFDSYFINPIVPPAILPDSGTYTIDSSLNVFSNFTLTGGGCSEEYLLIYKLNGKQGDQWVICDVGGGGYHYEMARIQEIREDVILGVPTKVMWIDYFLAADSTDTTGLGRGGDVLAKGFGLQARQSEGWPGIILKGAVLDGILYGDTTNVIVGVDDQNPPFGLTNFELNQNFPNPFNPQTTIRFYIPERSFIKLKVFAMLGDEVRLLLNEEKGVGYHEITFDGSGLPSGVYFYTLQTPTFSQTKKMVLLR